MPSFNLPISGTGGFLRVNGARWDISRWMFTVDPRLVERTKVARAVRPDGSEAASVGTRYRATVPDTAWTVELPWDDATSPKTAGLQIGRVVDLELQNGESEYQPWKLWETTVGPIEVVCDVNGDVVRLKISGKGGDLDDTDGAPVEPPEE